MPEFGLRLEDECFPTEPSQAVINRGEKDAAHGSVLDSVNWRGSSIARGQLNSSAYDIV